MSERGSAAAELAILAVPLMLVLAFLVSLLLVSNASVDLTGAAWDAARDASQHRSALAALTAARATATQEVGDRCATLGVNVGGDAFVPGGIVTVDLICVVADPSGPRGAQRTTLHARGAAVIDAFRGTG